MLINKIASVILINILVGLGCTSGNSAEQTKIQSSVETSAPKTLMPDFSLYDEKGNTINLKDFKGKKVFVNLWASWCPPCRAEMPSIQQLYNKTKGKNVQFVMLALDDDFKNSLKFIAESMYNFPVFYPAGAAPALFDVPGIPATFIFNEQGELIRKIEGGDNYNTEEYVKLLSN